MNAHYIILNQYCTFCCDIYHLEKVKSKYSLRLLLSIYYCRFLLFWIHKGNTAMLPTLGLLHMNIEDYVSIQFYRITDSVDLALDPLGGAETKKCYDLLSPLGALVIYGMLCQNNNNNNN